MREQDILVRYRHLREIGHQHHTAALKHLAGGAILERAKQLGICMGTTIVADGDDGGPHGLRRQARIFQMEPLALRLRIVPYPALNKYLGIVTFDVG